MHGANPFAAALLAALCVPVALTGCATSIEKYDRIRGVAPDDGSCRVVVYEQDSSRELRAETVRGRFSMGFALGDEHPRKFDIATVCGGRRTKFLRNIVPGAFGVTDLGYIGP